MPRRRQREIAGRLCGAARRSERLRVARVLAGTSARVHGAGELRLSRSPAVESKWKVDRGALPAPQRGPAARVDAPKDRIESGLAAIWCKLLGVSEVNSGDDFFALGGHSLLAVRLVAQIEKMNGSPGTGFGALPESYFVAIGGDHSPGWLRDRTGAAAAAGDASSGLLPGGEPGSQEPWPMPRKTVRGSTPSRRPRRSIYPLHSAWSNLPV